MQFIFFFFIATLSGYKLILCCINHSDQLSLSVHSDQFSWRSKDNFMLHIIILIIFRNYTKRLL